ncbi:MAG: PP2C family protein-serine/threonine phosphatase [Cyclobacteriaceae bacterium]|nr:PP2C family protein-serine/threonine phosphatase [Cyclobacteriaceae bacterium SS2]
MATSIDIRDLELNALLEITQAINNNLSEKDLYKIYKFTLLGDLKVKKLALFVHDNGWQCPIHFGTSKDYSKAKLDRSLTAIEEITYLNANEHKSEEFEIAIPVYHKQSLLAIVLIGGLPEESQEDSTTFLKALTNIIIVAIENKKLARRQLQQEAYRKELEIAKKVQNFLFPKSLPKTQKLNIEAVYLPHHDVGGDYYDYLSIDNDRFLICIADVSGKGVPAALLMSNFQASLRTLIRRTQKLDEIIVDLNHSTFISGNAENFITFFVGIYDFNKATFEYVNCGHNPLYLVNEKEVILLNDGTTILGMFDPLPFLSTHKIEDVRDFFFFGYTDGLTETFNQKEEQYGNEPIDKLLGKGMPEDLGAFHEHLLKDLDKFKEEVPYRDDITMLSCRVKNL